MLLLFLASVWRAHDCNLLADRVHEAVFGC